MPYLILVSLIWGFSFVIIKGSLASLDSNFVAFARILLSFLLFLPFLRWGSLRLRGKLELMLIGAVQFGLMYVAYIAAYRDLPAHVIALLTTTTPIFVSITVAIYERKLRGFSLLLALLAVAGGIILEFPDQPPAATVRGILLIQLSNAAFAFGQIAYKRWMGLRPGIQDRNVFVFLYAGAVAVTGAFSFITTDYRHLAVQSHQWLALLYLGFIASGLSFFLWNMGARKVNEGILAVMNNMKIPVGVIASLVILREKTGGWRLLAGCALIAAALYLNGHHSRSNRRKNSV
jgi:drug/metabolite transporter (DMT)-like permease